MSTGVVWEWVWVPACTHLPKPTLQVNSLLATHNTKISQEIPQSSPYCIQIWNARPLSLPSILTTINIPVQETMRELKREMTPDPTAELAPETAQEHASPTSDFLSRSGPVEIVLLIFKACNSNSDVLALTATCRRLYHVGRNYAVSRLASSWPLGEIPCFKEALTAVCFLSTPSNGSTTRSRPDILTWATPPLSQARMAQVVADAESRGELPPLGMIPTDLATPPSFSDLKAAFELSQVVEALECQILPLWGGGQAPLFYLSQTRLEPDGRMLESSTRIRKAIYRAFIVSAALAGVYNEPICKASLRWGKTKDLWRPSEEKLKFLQQFAVCRLEDDAKGDEAAFGRVARWLLADVLSDDAAKTAMAKRFREGSGRARYCQSRTADSPCPAALVDGGTHSDAHLVAWEVLQVLWVQPRIHRAVRQSPWFYPIPLITSVADYDSEEEEGFQDYPSTLALLPGFPKTIQNDFFRDYQMSALAVLPGVFNTFQIRVSGPDVVPRRMRAFLSHTPRKETVRYFQEDRTVAIGKSAAAFFYGLQYHSKRPHAVCSDMAFHLSLKFFRYFLRRHLDLSIDPSTYASRDLHGANDFLASPAIFLHDDVPGRRPHQHGASLRSADFIDGTEILVKAV